MDTKLADQPLGKALLELEGAEYLGTVSRERLIQEQLEAEVMLLPGKTDSPEMCCISVMECQRAGAFPIVGAIGALPERVPGKLLGIASTVLGLSVVPECFVQDAWLALMHSDALKAARIDAMEKWVRQYDYYALAPQWLARFKKELNA